MTYISFSTLQIENLFGAIEDAPLRSREIVVEIVIEHAGFVAKLQRLSDGFGHDGQNKSIDLQQKIAKHQNKQAVDSIGGAALNARPDHRRRRSQSEVLIYQSTISGETWITRK